MAVVRIDMPEDTFRTVRRSPDEVAREMRISAAVYWFAAGIVTQGQGAHLAGLSRSAFIDALGERGVSAAQETMEEIEGVLARG